ncbi:MAG: cupin domain-containing protein [Pseudomonadota bacterium]|nr:cupin domain-containing protein [Pseudomonadota bacterium]
MIRKNNINSDGWREASHGKKFHRSALSLGDVKDNSLLGCTAYSVQPGKQAFPKHGHLVNDEAIYVISGNGTLSIGAEETSVVPGDYIWLPRGSKNAHVLVNNGNDNLVYLCISTNILPDVVHYPDSQKLGVIESKNSWSGDEKDISGFYNQQIVDYYEGED